MIRSIQFFFKFHQYVQQFFFLMYGKIYDFHVSICNSKLGLTANLLQELINFSGRVFILCYNVARDIGMSKASPHILFRPHTYEI